MIPFGLRGAVARGHRSTTRPRSAHRAPSTVTTPVPDGVIHARGLSVPILMYHVIAAPPPGAPFPGLYVPASEFAGQMTRPQAEQSTA